jgi:SNF2 family DNA or RNA helicase
VDFELALSPTGRFSIRETVRQSTSSVSTDEKARRTKVPAHISRLLKSFDDSNGAGLFALAAGQFDSSWSPAFRYWRGFAGRFLDHVCQMPDGADVSSIPAPGDAEISSLILNAPPMPGAEYVSHEMLVGLWDELDVWFRNELKASKSLAAFLQRRAPLWHQVGRVCLHLAENRRDPDYPFAFLATYAPSTIGNGKKIQYQPLSKALKQYAGEENKDALIKLLSPIQLASESSELVGQLVSSGDLYEPLAWTPPEAYQFLKDVPVMEQSGITVRLPDWWKKRARPRVGITIGDTAQKRFDADGMLDFRMQVALGDEELTPEEFQALLDEEDGLVLLKGQWVEVDREKLQQALEHWQAVEEQATDGLSFSDGMRLLAGAPADLGDDSQSIQDQDWSFVNAGDWLGQLLRDMRSPESLGVARPGKELKATLRKYQTTGVNWLAFLSNLGLGACLADDMGLGKTIQVISLLLILKKRKVVNPSLLVLPASLVGNWKSEIEKFAPSLSIRFAHSSQTTKEELAAMADDPTEELKGVDVVLTTYGTLLRQPWLLEIDWQLAVLDEAQAIKNPSARQTKCVKQLKTASRIALTGTPVENRLGDLWSLFDFLCPGLLGSPQKFQKFIKALAARTEDQFAPLRRLVGPYMLRRLKTDKSVISDLPDKTEVTAYCGLSKRQATIYARLVKELAKTLKDQEGIQRRGVVLAYLMRFKQLCNHPSQLLGDVEFKANDSGKFLRLVEICDEIASRQEKALVFTQFRELADPLAMLLGNVFGQAGSVLHGGTAVRRRKKLVDEFQQDGGPPFFVLSLKAGGTGLNLTAASHVIHFDRWWNPAVENQATDRAFRIGQKRNVLVHKFVCQGTIEERIDSLIAEKTQLATEVLEIGGERMLTEMSDAELIDMVSLDVGRVNL